MATRRAASVGSRAASGSTTVGPDCVLTHLPLHGNGVPDGRRPGRKLVGSRSGHERSSSGPAPRTEGDGVYLAGTKQAAPEPMSNEFTSDIRNHDASITYLQLRLNRHLVPQ